MLVVINGIQNTSKQLLISKKLTQALNTFAVDGFRVTFNGDQYIISDSSGKELMYLIQPETPAVSGMNATSTSSFTYANATINSAHVSTNPDGTENYGENTPVSGTENVKPIEFVPVEIGASVPATTIAKVYALIGTINSSVANSHYGTCFIDIFYDLGLTTTPRIKVPTQTQNQTMPVGLKDSTATDYQDLISTYNSRPFDVMTVSGSFSAAVIAQLKTDLGASNVSVLNVVRNPSTCFVLNQHDQSYFTANPAATQVNENISLERSLINAAQLVKDHTITTIRYEDVIANGGFVYNGQTITILGDSAVGQVPYNTNITQYEYTDIVAKQTLTSQNVADWNTAISQCGITMNFTFGVNGTVTQSDIQERLTNLNTMYNSNVTLNQLLALNPSKASSVTTTLKDGLVLFNLIEGTNVTVSTVNSILPLNLFTALNYDTLSLSDVTTQ